tara:strand:+ start:458 stop:673 length:216 start_codon:yes stop_codon:yes gene_type:complete
MISFAGDPDQLALACYTYLDAWTLGVSRVDAANAKECNLALDAQLDNATQLIDFDDHLDDASLDWFNTWLK